MPIDHILANPSSQNRVATKEDSKGNLITGVVLQVPTDIVRDTGQDQVNPALETQGRELVRKAPRIHVMW